MVLLVAYHHRSRHAIRLPLDPLDDEPFARLRNFPHSAHIIQGGTSRTRYGIYILCWRMDTRRDGVRAARNPVCLGDKEGRLPIPENANRHALRFRARVGGGSRVAADAAVATVSARAAHRTARQRLSGKSR